MKFTKTEVIKGCGKLISKDLRCGFYSSNGKYVYCDECAILLKRRMIEMITQIELAKSIAIKAHKGQKRKDGKDYITHVEAVANKVCDIQKSIAWLHDVIEDTNLTKEDLISKGINESTAECVQALTRVKGTTYFDYINQIICSSYMRWIFQVKLADLEHNMSDLNEGSLKDKYRFAQEKIADCADYN